MIVALVGNVIDGLTIVGPYADFGEAQDNMETEAPGEFHLVELLTPGDFAQDLKPIH